MTTASLMDEVRAELQRDRRPAPLRVVAEKADVGYEWLVKFTHGHIDDPGISKVERVSEALERLRKRSRAA